MRLSRWSQTVFVDVRPDTLNLDETQIENAITDRTKAIVPVHTLGWRVKWTPSWKSQTDMVSMLWKTQRKEYAYYKGRALGSIGQMGAYSYHETKNYVCGEGGTSASIILN